MVELAKRNVNWHWIPLAKHQASLAAGELLMSQIAAVINLYLDWHSEETLYSES